MVRIPTALPESIVETVGGIFSGGFVDVLWKVTIGVLFLALIYLLSLMGIFGALIASALFSTLFSDDVRAAVIDIWNRDFWTAKV
ncbi:hypothetical protein [Haloarcula argentinensis]|uniref:Uncharacterized protein n=1 Tax=Haloarcula argentinensis TaxID=43776 RepID=A0A847UQ67_HALAR|nr:hypothetical protein [Haloarcula argentinensis]NLV14361.1 hypothetical protein [Haloarcula argentinensis]